MLAALAMVLVACNPQPGQQTTAPLGSPTASAVLDVRAQWTPCHQMGMCVYSAELVGPDGARSTASFEVLEGGLARLAPGLPAELRDGAYSLTLISVMLGDTLEPSGEQTVLGEDARCATEFTVGPGASKVAVVGSFMPRLCTVSVAEGPNLRVVAGPDRTSLVIEGSRTECNSMGGCAYVAQLAGPTGMSEADFIRDVEGNRITPAAGLPHFLDPGDYVLSFESRLMSDVVVAGQERDYVVGAACRTAFSVGASPEAILIHLEVRTGVCLISLERQPAP